MARPSFTVKHLIFCTEVHYPDVRRPQRNSTLDGVDYVFGVSPDTEFPFEPAEFWLYARLYSTSDGVGETPPLYVTCVWQDAPGGQEVEIWTHSLGRIALRQPGVVLERGWSFRNYEGGLSFRFPNPGRYAFQLWHPTRRYPRKRVKATEFIRVEVVP